MTTAENPSPTDPPILKGRAAWGMLRRFTGDRLELLRFWNEEATDGIAESRIGRRVAVFINRADLIGDLLLERASDFHKGPVLSIYGRPLLGNGLLSSEEEFHRHQRKLVTPAFAHKRIVNYAQSMAAVAERAQKRWADGDTIHLPHEMMRMTLGIVGKTLFDQDTMEAEADELGSALTVAMEYLIKIVSRPIRPPITFVPPWQPNVKNALRRLDETVYRLIDERRAANTDVGDLLSMLLLARDENGAAMDNKQIRDEAMTLFLAGHETTAVALSWAFHLLTAHPEIYAAVRNEAISVLQGRSPTYADLERLPLAERVFKEAMRLYPPAFAIARQAIRDTQLGNYRIRKGTVAIVSPYILHRDPIRFPDPLKFDPSRFTETNEKNRPRYDYMPFGGGPRICIGAAFALMEGQLSLAALAQRVTFVPVAPDALWSCEPLLTLRPKGDNLQMRVRRSKDY